MPYGNITDNRAVINAAVENVKKRYNIAWELSKKSGKDDTRNFADIANLIIDVQDIPEGERDAYYLNEVKKMADAFNTVGPIPGKPDPEAIKPYIKQMFEKVTTDPEIDWSNQRQVENLFKTIRITQALATVVDDFLPVCLDLFPTNEQMRKLDATTTKAYMLYLKLAPQLARAGMGLEIDENFKLGIYGSDSPLFDAQAVIGSGVSNAILNDENVITIDPTENELMKKHLLKEQFEVEQAGGTCSQNDYELYFQDALAGYSSNTSLEQVVFKAVKDSMPYDEFNSDDLLMINGKSVHDIAKEMGKAGKKGYEISHEVAKKVRDAMTDGKSVVSLMSISYTKEGAVEFKHRELKVDLDKLNEVDRKETKYSRFRRFLDRVGFWKIKRFASNAERDARQEKIRESDAYKNALRSAEDRYIHYYNIAEKSTKSGVGDLIPKMARAEEILEKQTDKQLTENNVLREPVGKIELEKEEKNVSTEPKKEIDEKVIKTDAVTK